ncbi:DUF3301 domain-containing protein [Vibrio sp. SCSIO 43136]|uniref:DUF3301 domain-containing protein n=1 Tax=Vibrio sp. SCSIO 43136 TaxID=2819101 RepID=UPI0020759DE8|nr:DUF3301 domain-containing protein [Vibrio sp. SCSIO 43136]USD65891.1 DUF3301 domain-containing protein [Vibrio sp. SCSIO 43136]
MIGDLFAILGLVLFCALFWQQRRQSELAKAAIAHRCKKLELQLLSVAFKGHKMRHKDGRLGWHTLYQFEFSSLGDDCYQGELVMVGFAPTWFNLPAYRV